MFTINLIVHMWLVYTTQDCTYMYVFTWGWTQIKATRRQGVLGMCCEIGSHFHPSGKWMTPSQTYILVNKWVIIFFNRLLSRNFGKFNINFANISQNLGAFAGKYLDPILGPNLYVWISFYFDSGTSLPKKKLNVYKIIFLDWSGSNMKLPKVII